MTEEHDPLQDAFRAMREGFDGQHPDPEAALRRILLRTRESERKRRITRWTVLPIAAALVASTAWAGVTGRLAPATRSVVEWIAPASKTPTSMQTAEPAETTQLPPPSAAPEPPPNAAPEPPPAPVTPSPSPSPVVDARPRVVAPPNARPHPAPPAAPAGDPIDPPAPAAQAAASATPAPSDSADPATALFAEANRLHFTDKDPARALVAWDRYLAAAPQGRFAPEARYNRALTLIRLGRTREAVPELNAFASGAYGDYRRDEARALVDAITRDAAP